MSRWVLKGVGLFVPILRELAVRRQGTDDLFALARGQAYRAADLAVWRPRLYELAASHGVQLLCYGTLAGGFLSERWLGRAAPPADPGNRSLVKYRLIIDEFGGWDAFQALLRAAGFEAVASRRDLGGQARCTGGRRPAAT